MQSDDGESDERTEGHEDGGQEGIHLAGEAKDAGAGIVEERENSSAADGALALVGGF